MRITVPSFAKINWSLEILGKRDDGFHEVLTVLQTLDFGDQITFDHAGSGITLKTEGRQLCSGPDNLICRAARVLRERAGVVDGAQIRLTKRIPVGAGLGGGSSNAAVTLLALNQLWNCRLGRKELWQLAAGLGSDVPFFLDGGTGLGWGRGEHVTPMPELSKRVPILVCYPRFQVSAGGAYSEVEKRPHNLTRPDLNTTIRRFHKVLEEGRWGTLRNDLERPVFSRFSVLASVKRKLISAGCDWAMLSGSGSALFGVSSAQALRMAREKLAESGDVEIILCQTMNRREYAASLQEAGLRIDPSPERW